MPISDMTIPNAKPREKIYRLYDRDGLYLEVSPNGGKWWRFKYRFAKKEKRISLGVFPEVDLKTAREKTFNTRAMLANGIDPGDHRKVAAATRDLEATNTFEHVAREWLAKKMPVWVPSHSIRIVERLEKDVFPWLGHKVVDKITAPEILSTVRRIESRGAIEPAHRALSNCGQVLRYAVATGRATTDVSRNLRGALQPVKPTHLAAVTDPKELGRVLNAIYEYKGSFIVRCALRLAPLFFVRPGELRNAKWADFDFANAEWRFVASKTKTPHIVPLAKQSLSILTELKPHTRNSEYVFPNPRSIKRPLSDNAVLAGLRRMGIDKTEMSGHGFRATARTILDEVLGFRPDFIEHQLAHAVRDPNGRAYNRTAHLADRRKMMQAWADYLDHLRQPLNTRADTRRHDPRPPRTPRAKRGHRPSAAVWNINQDLFGDTTEPSQSRDDEPVAPIETVQ